MPTRLPIVNRHSSQAKGVEPVKRMPAGKTQRASSRALLGEGNELIIEHAGREYRLRVTQSGKLILTA